VQLLFDTCARCVLRARNKAQVPKVVKNGKKNCIISWIAVGVRTASLSRLWLRNCLLLLALLALLILRIRKWSPLAWQFVDAGCIHLKQEPSNVELLPGKISYLFSDHFQECLSNNPPVLCFPVFIWRNNSGQIENKLERATWTSSAEPRRETKPKSQKVSRLVHLRILAWQPLIGAGGRISGAKESNWVSVTTAGETPSPRYGHSIVRYSSGSFPTFLSVAIL